MSTVRLRRRSKPSLRARLRRGVVALVVLGAVLGYAIYWLATWPGFHLSRITVGGAHAVSASEIIRRAGIDPNANIWLLNPSRVASRVEAIPRIDEAWIHRSFPGVVRIDVTERKPSGCVVFADGQEATIDRANRILADGCDDDLAAPEYRVGRPIRPAVGAFLHDPLLDRLEGDEATLAGAGLHVAAIGVDRYDGLEAHLGDGLLLRFGDDADLAQKARLIKPILAATRPRLKTLQSIDVRAPRTPVVQYR